MFNKSLRRWLLATCALTLASVVNAQSVRISEFHYDNASTDSGEAVEVSAPAGTDLTGWSIVLYNGSNGATYDTDVFNGVVPATCGDRGVAVMSYPSNGIQNGPNDGIALLSPAGAVVEFLSYEGPITATNGPALGLTSVDIGVQESGTGPDTESISRDAAGVWSLGTRTFGVCNDQGETPPVEEVASVSVTPQFFTIYTGSSITFSAAALDASGNPINGAALTWSSGDPGIATVSATGFTVAVAEGSTVIMASADNGVTGFATLYVVAAPPLPVSDFHFNEIHYDNLSTDAGEAIEIEGPAGADLTGLSVVLYNGNGGVPYGLTQSLAGVMPATCGARGVVVLNYPVDGLQNGSPDGMALVDSAGQVLEFLSYEGVLTAMTGPAMGLTSVDIGASQTNAVVGTSLQRSSTNSWAAATSSFGACNVDPIPGSGNHVTFTGRLASDPALPVGYEDQLFPTLRDANNASIPSTFTWISETPSIASIEQNGVMRALGVGTAILRATAADGTTSTISLPTHVAVASGVTYPGNTEFGEPADADASDDFIVRHEQFTASYNQNRGGPNWVSYDLDAAHFGAEDRCDCFTMDADLPSSFTRLTTADYTDASAFHGYGIDRGHMVRSFDRTTGSLDNARTYLFSNVVPQASDMNQGPWANLENDLGVLARTQNREVYIITGPAGNKGTLKNQGKIVIPTSTWKVAVILEKDLGLADIVDYRDLEVIAVNMPNEAGVRNVDWNTYRTTVDEIETLTGYDLLALLPDKIEAAVESNTQPPLAAIAGPAGSVIEGSEVAVSAAGAVDPNGSIVSYDWDFGDGSIGSGVAISHTYAEDGAFTVRLTVTDNDGFTDDTSFTVTVVNVAPVVDAIPATSLNVGATYTVAGTFADPGADAWTAVVDWGDGSGLETLALTSRDFSLTHIYTTAGTYTVGIQISDDDVATPASTTVTVIAPAPGLAAVLPLLDQLIASGDVGRAVGTVLKAQVIAAQMFLGRGNTPAAATLVRAMIIQIDLLVRWRVVPASTLAPVRGVLVQVLGTLGT